NSYDTIDIYPGTRSSTTSPTGFFEVIEDKLYFTATDPLLGQELRILDTSDNSWETVDAFPGSPSSAPQSLAIAGHKVYFAANHPKFGLELFAFAYKDAPTPPPLPGDYN